ncbi:MFS transporter [Acidisphaera sp. L21]|jgi:putative MFS transporter|uniref:MFS transporter n=1 Tax=Acidisphaera sp. L21 TaxID=1641851 RepID=UPI00131B1ED9|nr:MFS transporter [Acidisphaera sp. L21]
MQQFAGTALDAAAAPAEAIGVVAPVTAQTLAARIDQVPITNFHRRLLFIIGAGMFFDSFDLYLAGTVLGTLLHDGWSTLPQNAQFVSFTFVGMVIGAFGAGFLGDKFGRRFTYQFNLLIFGLASLAAAAAPTMGWLIGARFVSGIGLGAEIVIGYATLIEFAPAAKRGKWAALLSLITNFGLLGSTLLSWLIIPSYGWRGMFVFAGVGALIVLVLRKSMPESPRWLDSQGRTAEAEAIVARIEASAAGLPRPPVPLVEAPRVRSLPRGTMMRRMIVGSLLQVIAAIASYGFVVWVPTFLVKSGVSVTGSLGQTLLMSMGGPAGAFLGYLLSDRIGRRPLIITASLLAAVCGMAFASATSAAMAVPIGFVMFALVFFLVSIVVAGYVPEMFPTPIRMRANGTCATVGRLATIGIPYAVVWLFTEGGVIGVLGGVTCAMLIQATAVGFWGPETAQHGLDEGDTSMPLRA